jgi:hypothetical protein
VKSVERSKQVYVWWLEATVLFYWDCIKRKKEIYIHLVLALLRPVGNALYAPLATPCAPRACE